jgi:hypothetical protein
MGAGWRPTLEPNITKKVSPVGHTFLLTLSERSEPKGLLSMFEVKVFEARSRHSALRAPVRMTAVVLG